ncbi:MAG: hypothetical protein C4330_03170 [Chitinophagaceae bacterium]
MRVSVFISFVSLILINLIGSSCANIVPPSGGPRDSLPPKLLKVEPKDSSLNFRSKTIVFTFDEYVDLQDVSNNLLFTPIFPTNPEVQVKLKTVTVKFRDTLLPNTTYVLNFGNAIKDINEGNVLRNFKYVFSTGPILDSLTLNGKVIIAETGKIDTTLQVILHKDLSDTAVRKKAPNYAARLDGSGNFRFTNLPAGDYAIYALGDAGIIRRYLDTTKLFAFSDSVVRVAPNRSPQITLYAYKQSAAVTSTSSNSKAPSDKKLRIINNLNSNQQDLLSDLEISFEQPLRFFDSTKIAVSTDSAYKPLTNYTVVLDSLKKKLRLNTQWNPNTKYHLVFDKDFAEDTLGRRLAKTDTLSFTTKKLSDYGNITIRVRNVDAKRNPVLQFLQNDAVVFATPISSGRFTQKLFAPGEYSLRILYDTNSNGKWDPGHFFGVKRQPELVQNIDRKIVIKPGAANEFEISL